MAKEDLGLCRWGGGGGGERRAAEQWSVLMDNWYPLNPDRPRGRGSINKVAGLHYLVVWPADMTGHGRTNQAAQVMAGRVCCVSYFLDSRRQQILSATATFGWIGTSQIGFLYKIKLERGGWGRREMHQHYISKTLKNEQS